MVDSERSDHRGGGDIRTSGSCQRKTTSPELSSRRWRCGWGENITEVQRRDAPKHAENLHSTGSGSNAESSTDHHLHFRSMVTSPQKMLTEPVAVLCWSMQGVQLHPQFVALCPSFSMMQRKKLSL